VLEGTKTVALDKLKAADPTFCPSSVVWALTVPAIWSEEAKSAMRKAAEMAGLVRAGDPSDAHRLILVLEPEAAAIAALATVAPAVRARVVPGMKLLIMDCGGGTIDITSSIVRRFEGTDLALDELQAPGGGPWGGTAVDREFNLFLGRTVCGQTKRAGKGVHRGAWLPIAEAWIDAKKSFQREDVARTYDVELTQLIDYGFLDTAEASISAANARLARDLKFAGCQLEVIGRRRNSIKLRLTGVAMSSFFAPSITHTVDAAKRMLRHPEAMGTSLVLVVGGYAASEALFGALQRELSTTTRSVVRPDGTWQAVARGAVLFGLSPTAFVTSR